MMKYESFKSKAFKDYVIMFCVFHSDYVILDEEDLMALNSYCNIVLWCRCRFEKLYVKEKKVVLDINMNPDYSKSFEQDVGSDGLPELDYVASMSRDNEESNENEIDYEFSEEDGPPVLEDFHEKTDQRLNFDATTEAVAELNRETHAHSHETCSDYNCQIKSAPFSERCRTNCFGSKEPAFTGHSYKRSNDSFGEHRRGASHRFHMIDADDCADNFDSEKDDDKMDEDDDDLTKKLLSIQVLPRIPKLKRTGMSVGGASSESSAPQRSVLERAEVATKSSSYPKWPKSNGSQADDKHRWHNERKGRDAKHGSRNRKETELRTDSSRNFVHSRPSDRKSVV